jgi:hypothetical protein
MASAPLNASRANRIWIVVLIVLALLSFAAMRRSMVKAMSMKAETTSAASFAQLKPGDEAKLVLQLTAADPASNIEGTVLAKQTETIYRRTSDTAKITVDAATPVVMGKPSDVRAGAVVHITAKMGAHQRLHASQIVILTGYVTVQ